MFEIREGYAAAATGSAATAGRFLAFDYDGTLITYKRKYSFVEQRMEMVVRAGWLLATGHNIVVFSNRGDAACRRNLTEALQPLADFIGVFEALREECNSQVRLHVYAALGETPYRKPSVRMWSAFFTDASTTAASVEYFAGDAHVEDSRLGASDYYFAKNGGVRFVTEAALDIDPKSCTSVATYKQTTQLEHYLSDPSNQDAREEALGRVRDAVAAGPVCIALVGYPASGKSTFAQSLAENNEDVTIVSRDLHGVSWERRFAQAQERVVIVDNNTLTQDARTAIARVCGSQRRVLFVWLDTPLVVCKHYAAVRYQAGGSKISSVVYAVAANKFEPPIEIASDCVVRVPFVNPSLGEESVQKLY
jgi:histidinol phosphatase-like enzyme